MDWIGAILILISMVITGKKLAWGWLVSALGGVIYLIVGWQNDLHGIVFMEIVLIITCIYNYIQWTKTKKDG